MSESEFTNETNSFKKTQSLEIDVNQYSDIDYWKCINDYENY